MLIIPSVLRSFLVEHFSESDVELVRLFALNGLTFTRKNLVPMGTR